MYHVAVVGATGLVGRKMLQVLEERKFPVRSLTLLASQRSAGTEIPFGGEEHAVQTLTPASFAGVDVALFSAGAAVSKEYVPLAARAGALAIDNSSAFRMDPAVPLVVPEVNRAAIFTHQGIIANPNCSTIQMVVVLKPLHDRWTLRRIVVATYQSVTGAGYAALRQLEEEAAGREPAQRKIPHRIAFNVVPQVDVFLADGSSREERKMMEETRKILGLPALPVAATCVRVPVYGGHSEAVNVELEREFTLDDVRAALAGAPGVSVKDRPADGLYPMPFTAWDRDEVFVGRIRRDLSVAFGLDLWIVADNLRKGAATNAVQIAEAWSAGA